MATSQSDANTYEHHVHPTFDEQSMLQAVAKSQSQMLNSDMANRYIQDNLFVDGEIFCNSIRGQTGEDDLMTVHGDMHIKTLYVDQISIYDHIEQSAQPLPFRPDPDTSLRWSASCFLAGETLEDDVLVPTVVGTGRIVVFPASRETCIVNTTYDEPAIHPISCELLSYSNNDITFPTFHSDKGILDGTRELLLALPYKSPILRGLSYETDPGTACDMLIQHLNLATDGSDVDNTGVVRLTQLHVFPTDYRNIRSSWRTIGEDGTRPIFGILDSIASAPPHACNEDRDENSISLLAEESVKSWRRCITFVQLASGNNGTSSSPTDVELYREEGRKVISIHRDAPAQEDIGGSGVTVIHLFLQGNNSEQSIRSITYNRLAQIHGDAVKHIAINNTLQDSQSETRNNNTLSMDSYRLWNPSSTVDPIHAWYGYCISEIYGMLSEPRISLQKKSARDAWTLLSRLLLQLPAWMLLRSSQSFDAISQIMELKRIRCSALLVTLEPGSIETRIYTLSACACVALAWDAYRTAEGRSSQKGDGSLPFLRHIMPNVTEIADGLTHRHFIELCRGSVILRHFAIRALMSVLQIVYTLRYITHETWNRVDAWQRGLKELHDLHKTQHYFSNNLDERCILTFAPLMSLNDSLVPFAWRTEAESFDWDNASSADNAWLQYEEQRACCAALVRAGTKPSSSEPPPPFPSEGSSSNLLLPIIPGECSTHRSPSTTFMLTTNAAVGILNSHLGFMVCGSVGDSGQIVTGYGIFLPLI